ncbi:hypothetical protein HHL17_24710 [Chitinophaga sp. G-6-1-13]|uniref:Uncharacterized protein n=1 Tax=Chitinophaga fulva TaxID=2728842 RepID=A0A848GTH5_9BACT|nr:hypothetical protein [Chitinophaga fulva]NML40422.1 hypothetical protein [Chitinophaga fulva]
MAKAIDNVILYGAHGTIAKQLVVRQRFGQSILSKRPTRSKGKATEAQQAVRDRFLSASLYAKSVMANPVLLDMYRAAAKNGLSAYNVAMLDALRPPEIKDVNTAAYTGKTGETFLIRAIDEFKVKAVTVSIYSADNQLVETGAAVLQVNGLDWLYTATKDLNTLTGTKIKAEASDLPGNTAVKEMVL